MSGTLIYSQLFSYFENPNVAEELGGLQSGQQNHQQDCLIYGPRSSGRTSMLFHAAVSSAASGNHVLYICPKRVAEEVPPPLPYGVTPKNMLLANIHMKYLDTRSDIICTAASLHLSPFAPDYVIIDDMSAFAAAPDPRAKEKELMKLLALTTDAVKHFRQRGRNCHLLMSDMGEEGLNLQFIYEHWLSLILHIKDTAEGGFVLGPIWPKTALEALPRLQYTLHPNHGTMLQAVLEAQG